MIARLAALALVLAVCSGGSAAVAAEHLVGLTDPNEEIAFSVVLQLAPQAALDAERSPTPIGAPEFGRRYGISRDALRRVELRLVGSGIEVVGRYPQRTALEVRARARDLSALFQVQLAEYVDAEGRRFRVPLGHPIVPRDLRSAVSGVAGLSTRPVSITSAVPTDGFRPADLAKAYNVLPLRKARNQGRGRGQTIAVVSFASFLSEDIATFDGATGVKGRRIERVKVAGGSNDVTSALALEVALDLQTVRGMAPQSRIVNYEHPYTGTLDSFTRGIGATMDTIVEQGRADVVSISYGICDVPTTRRGDVFLPEGDRLRAQNAFKAAVRVGMTVFVATQDQGAYTCQRFDFADHRLSTSWPSGDPNVVAVGGTRLSVEPDGSYRAEAGWEDVLSTFGGGGGLNPSDERPEWQSGPGLDNRMRQLPDVAAASDSDSGVFVVFRGRKTVVGGTSAATPFWAGITALINERARRERLGAVGYLNPILYAIYRAKPSSGAFHDVTRGGNRYYAARPGWDYSTGLGSPDVALLADEVLAHLRSNGRG